MSETRVCTKCSEEKVLELFSRRGGDGFKSTCKACDAAYAREFRKRNPGYKGTGKLKKYKHDEERVSRIRRSINGAKQRAKKYDYVCDIDFEYAYDIFLKQDGKCAISGIELSFEIGHHHVFSLDKIDPSKGYVKGNVQWLSWSVNRAKGDLSMEIFTHMCTKIIETCNDYRKDS